MLRKLMKSIREYKTASILSILFVTLEAVMECALPLATSKLVDQVNDKNMSELTRVCHLSRTTVYKYITLL